MEKLDIVNALYSGKNKYIINNNNLYILGIPSILMKDITTIKVSRDTRNELANLKFIKKGDSFDSIINKLIEIYKKR